MTYINNEVLLFATLRKASLVYQALDNPGSILHLALKRGAYRIILP